MSMDMMIYLGFGFFLVIIFLVIYLKDLESNRKFERFERVIEDLNQQLHKVHQALSHKSEADKVWVDDLKLEFHKKVQDEINTKVLPLLDSLKEIEDIISDFKSNQHQRISKLEQRAKGGVNLPPNPSSNNEKEVIRSYNEGKQVYQIAKDMRIGIGEVEFILKMNNLL